MATRYRIQWRQLLPEAGTDPREPRDGFPTQEDDTQEDDTYLYISRIVGSSIAGIPITFKTQLSIFSKGEAIRTSRKQNPGVRKPA